MTPVEFILAAWAAGERDLHAALGRAVLRAAPATPAEAEALADAIREGLPDEPGERLRAADAGFLHAVARHAAGFEPVPGAQFLRGVLSRAEIAPVFLPGIGESRTIALPAGRPGMPDFSDPAFEPWFAATGAVYGLGLYGEERAVYRSAQFAGPASPERRTIHLGVDVFAPAGTPVHAPLPGRVAAAGYNADPLDYGHTLILEHSLEGCRFWTLYGHLGAGLPRQGQAVAAGQAVGHLGSRAENGGWAPHLHLQLITDRLGQAGKANFPGVGHRSLWPVWAVISPDPNLILRLPPGLFAA